MDRKSAFKISQKNSLRRTIFWSFVAVMLVPMLLIGGIVACASVSGNRQVVESKLLAVSALKESAINRWLNGVENRLTESGTQNIAARTLYEFERRPDRAEYLVNRFRYDILAIRGNSSDFDTIFLLDANGTVKASTNLEMTGSSYSGQEIFERGLENTYIHPLTYDDQLKQTVLYISTPVNSTEGEIVGVLAAKVNLQVLEEVMLATVDPDQEHTSQSESYLSAYDGVVLAPNLAPRPDAQGSLGINSGLDGQSDIDTYPNYAGVQVFGAYRPIHQLTAALLVEQPIAAAFQVIIRTAIALAVLSIAIIALTLYGAYRLTSLIVNPIQDLTQTATNIAGGDLNETISLDREDEIGVLAQAFNYMTTRLRDLISTLESRVERRTQALQTSAKVSRSITGTLELDSLLLQVSDLVNKSFGYYYVQVFLKDAQDYLITRAGSGEIGERMTAEGYKVKLGDQSLVGQAALGKYQVIADATQDPDWQSHPLLTEIVSELALPIRYGDAILGVLDLQCCKVNAFSDEDIPILQSIADQLAIAVRNVRLFQESEAARVELEEIGRSLVHRRAQLQTAIQVSNAAIAITDPQDLIQQAVDLIKKHFNFYYVGLFLADDQNQWAILKAGTGQAGKKQLAAKHRLKLDGDSMIGWSISNRQARITGDVRQDTVHYTNPYLPETQSEMALPLVSRNETLGAISVQSAQENAFSEEDINVLQSVADQIAIALQNSQFLSRIQTIQARFEGLYHRAPTGYHTTSADGFILEINDTELAMLGREGQRQEIINHLRFGDFLADESKAQYQTALKRLLEKGQKVENLELLSLHQNGYYFPILMTAAPELDETGQVKEIYASVQDISRQKEIEAARESLLEETETLYNLSQELMAAKSREDIYQVSINAIKTTSPSRGIAILMYDRSPVEITLNLAALWHNPRQTWPPVSLGATFSAADLDLPGGILLSGDTVVSLDGPADERFTETLHQLLSYMQIRSMVAAPIWSRDMVIGFVLVGHSASIPFTKTDIRLIKGVAQQMSISMDNLGLLQETLQRAAQLEIAAEVAKNTTTEVNLDALLSKVVDLLEDSLGYYHTAIFLVDEYQQYAVVEAAAGRGEETLFTQKYKLSLNISSQVGSVIETGKAKITPDIAKTLNYLEHPLLSDTRSELTLPLIVHGKVIGALDVQSDKPNDFQLGEDIVLQTIADQLANAIYVARLFARELAAAQEIQNLHKHYLQDEWETFLDAAENEERTSFVILPDDVSGQEKQAIAEINTWISRSIASAEEAKSSVQRTLPATDDNSRPQSALISPLILRDTPLGALGLIDQDDRQWTEDDLAIIEAISAQAALAIENARLIEETQRWALEQQQVAEKLRAVDKLKTQFLANMSHELRTPLNSIIGFSRVILKGIDGPLTELQKTDLSSIYQSGKHLLDLINNILDLAKIEAGKVDLNFVPVDLNSLLKGLASTAAGLVKDKEIKIIDHIVESLPVIEGDDVRIRQIFLNLISNSAKFTEKGSITLSASYTQTHVSVSISDTGIGISPQNREYIFDEFTQVDASTTRQAGGTGLGLPITQKFVELHHGQIIVESEAHRGATFTVVLPIRQPNSGRDQDNSPSLIEQSAESQPPPTLLVIDGDARVADIYRQYLQDKKFNFVSLNKGSGAAARANELQPYAILLDVLIPDADGWSILGELKENPGTAHIPVIICSIVDDKFRANQLGAAEYLLKPIIKNDLLQAIERLEEHKKNFKQVLVIDDNAEDILLIKRILRAHECQIIEALNGLDGLDIIYRNPPSLIVLDLTMPDLDGFGVLESLRDKQKTKNIPVIVITARELDNDELEIVNRQANALLLKGKYTDVELLQYVNKFLGDNS